MAEQTSRAPVSRDEASVRRTEATFQEAPGETETEADAVREAFLRGAGRDAAPLGAALSSADGTTQALTRLQRVQGNHFVQRVVAAAQGTPGRLVGRSQSDMVREVHERKESGTPLPDGTRQRMEGFFGANLSGVRVHAGGQAAALSRELNANAFTVGRDIFFAEGRYDPGSTAGQATLAHEVTHVRQQAGLGGHGVQPEGADEEQDQVQADAVQRQNAPGDQQEEEQLQADAVQREGEEEDEAAAG